MSGTAAPKRCLEEPADGVPRSEDQYRSDEGGDRDYEQHEPGSLMPLLAEGIEPPATFSTHGSSLTHGFRHSLSQNRRGRCPAKLKCAGDIASL